MKPTNDTLILFCDHTTSKRLLNKSLFLVLSVLLTALLHLKCGRDAKPPQDAQFYPIRVAYLPLTADAMFFAAVEKGFFHDDSILIEPTRMTSANQAMDALIAGRVDAAIMIGYSTLLPIAAKDSTIFKVVQSALETESLFTSRILVRRNLKINSIPDLRGRTIGTYTGLTQLVNLKLVLKQFLNPEKDITIVQVEPNLQVAGLAAGRFDALFTIDPYATAAIKQGIAEVLVNSPRAKYILNPFPTAATIMSTKLLMEHPSVSAKFVSALEKASKWVDENPVEAARITSMPDYTGLTEDVVLSSGTYLWWNIGEEEHDVVSRFVHILFENKLITNKVSVNTLFLSRSQLGDTIIRE